MIIVASARHDENGKYTKGKAGDQIQKSSTNDTSGEVSMQKMYNHSKGWYVSRLKSVEHADKIAERMTAAANNPNIGYDQYDRLGVVKNGIDTKVKTDSDCSSLVREAFKEATGKDPGNFTTANETVALEATGLVEKKFKYVSQEKTPLYNGDILTTVTKGHTVVVVSGNPRPRAAALRPITEVAKDVLNGKYGNNPQRKAKLIAEGYNYEEVRAAVNKLADESISYMYYPKYTGNATGVDTVLKHIGVPSEYRGSWRKRKPIADKNGITNYTGKAGQNITIISLAKAGALLKP